MLKSNDFLGGPRMVHIWAPKSKLPPALKGPAVAKASFLRGCRKVDICWGCILLAKGKNSPSPTRTSAVPAPLITLSQMCDELLHSSDATISTRRLSLGSAHTHTHTHTHTHIGKQP